MYFAMFLQWWSFCVLILCLPGKEGPKTINSGMEEGEGLLSLFMLRMVAERHNLKKRLLTERSCILFCFSPPLQCLREGEIKHFVDDNTALPCFLAPHFATLFLEVKDCPSNISNTCNTINTGLFADLQAVCMCIYVCLLAHATNATCIVSWSLVSGSHSVRLIQ